MNYKQFKYLVYTDLYRWTGKSSKKIFVRNLIFNVGFRYCFLLRSIKFLRTKKAIKLLLYPFVRILYKHSVYKFGIHISTLDIGKGFYIGHFGGIFINRNVKIGDNVNIDHDITIGGQNRGDRQGYPVIGNNVYLGPGVVIFGNIKIGDNAAVGANCVVTKDVPANGVVVGIPGKIISYQGSEGYINNTDYQSFDEYS